MKAIVLCAGYGRRLGALTRETPKSLLPLAGEPLLAHTLRHLAAHGIREVGINLHYRGAQIRSALGHGSACGVRVTWVDEPELRGTAGALRGFDHWLAGEPGVLVLYGDLLLDQDPEVLVETQLKTGADATLLLHRRAGSNSHVELDASGRIRAFVERPDAARRAELGGDAWVNSGMQVVGRAILDAIPAAGEVDLPRDVYAPGVDSLHLQGVPLTGYRCAIDSPRRYEEARAALAEGRCRPGRPA